MPILIFWPGVAAPAGVSRETWPCPAGNIAAYYYFMYFYTNCYFVSKFYENIVFLPIAAEKYAGNAACASKISLQAGIF